MYWNLGPKEMLLTGEAIGSLLGHVGSTVMNGISSLIKKAYASPELFYSTHHVRKQHSSPLKDSATRHNFEAESCSH